MSRFYQVDSGTRTKENMGNREGEIEEGKIMNGSGKKERKNV